MRRESTVKGPPSSVSEYHLPSLVKYSYKLRDRFFPGVGADLLASYSFVLMIVPIAFVSGTLAAFFWTGETWVLVACGVGAITLVPLAVLALPFGDLLLKRFSGGVVVLGVLSVCIGVSAAGLVTSLPDKGESKAFEDKGYVMGEYVVDGEALCSSGDKDAGVKGTIWDGESAYQVSKNGNKYIGVLSENADGAYELNRVCEIGSVTK